jgi:signal transduction histidine kinase
LDSTLRRLQQVRQRLQENLRGQGETLEDLEHQLVSPLLTATSRTDHVLRTGRFDKRTGQQLRAVRGLCRKASRVALSAGVFATLSRGQQPTPKAAPIGSDDMVRLLIAAADDAQVLSSPRRGIRFEVDRDSVRVLGRRLVRTDRSFLEQSAGNLLDNAAKYSFQDTEVTIRGELRDDRFAVQVLNRGLPMHGDELERSLERNWRGRAARNATGERLRVGPVDRVEPDERPAGERARGGGGRADHGHAPAPTGPRRM